MKILCAYFDPPDSYLNGDPVEQLANHEITTAHSYAEVRTLLHDPAAIPPFDVVLIDHGLPGDTEGDLFLFPVLPLFIFAEDSLVRGFGLFLPRHFGEVFSQCYDSFHAVVADNTCWDTAGKRDWQKLLGLVMRKLKEIEA